MNLSYRSNYSYIYLTNFLPIITTNMLRKGEKEKSFVKVNKVLQKIKKTAILQDSFIINKKLFLNKIYYFGFKKNKSITTINLTKNPNLFFNISKKTREIHDFLLKVRIFFFLSNLYSNDFLQYERYKNNLLKNIFDKKMKLAKNNRNRIKIKLLVKKKIFELLFNYLKTNKSVFIIKQFNNKLLKNNLLLNRKYDLKVLINNLLKNFFIIKKILLKERKIFKIDKTIIFINFKNFNYFDKLRKKEFLIKITKNLKKNKRYHFKKYYYLNKRMKLVKNEHYKLNKRFFLLKKLNKRMTRFEFKKRKYLYDKLKKIYKKSRFAFFQYKRKIFFFRKKNLKKKNNFIQSSSILPNSGTAFGLKLFVIKKPIINKKIKRKNFFKYSIFPVLFSPVKFLNIILSKYRLYFTFKEKRLWGKNQLIPSILNLKRDVRITARNFKKSLQDVKFEGLDFGTSIYESLLFAGAKKGFLLKIKQQAYVFMLKNAIFLQFMLRRRKKVSRRKRRKKIDRK